MAGSLQQRLQALFRESTVKIVTSTNIRGTGFFVAPGLIVTCTHVLLQEKSSQWPDVTVFWNQHSYAAKIERMLDRTHPDIALLSVDCPEHPYVALGEDIVILDRLYCYGYPDDHQDGDSVTLEYEGPSDEGAPLLKLKFGQVRPALSGAPLLNLRTGRVCGIVKRTRDRETDLGGRAISAATVLQEFEQVKAAQQKVGENSNPWHQLLEEVHNPTHLAHETTHYFSYLSTFLEMEGRWFLDDLRQGVIYIPRQEYFEKLEQTLATHHRALLMGESAAGKTVLALTFARYLQEHAHYTVCYKDVKQAEPGDGRKWYALMMEHDQPGLLYILDNCHLLAREVDDFCRHWKDQPPLDTQCLLISRVPRMKLQNRSQSPSEEDAYIQSFSDEEQLQVRAEDIFSPVVEQYVQSVAALSPQNGDYAATLKNDDVEKIKQRHGVNLVILRSLLDTWRIHYVAGKRPGLSDVKLEDAYQLLEDRYLSAEYGPTLATLCVLQRFEIRIHVSFIEQEQGHEAFREGIRQLEREKLLTRSRVKGYGQFYDLLLHQATARELFLAYVYNRYGYYRQEDINALAIDVLERYLKTKPPNFTVVYENIARYRQDDILEHLLNNRDLQTATISQFNRDTIVDAIRYAHRVAKFDATTASTSLEKIVRVSGREGIGRELLKSTFQDAALLLQYVQAIDSTLAVGIADVLDSEQFAGRIDEETIQSLFRLVRTLQAIAPSQAQRLLLFLPAEGLVAKATLGNLQNFIKQLQLYHYPHAHLTRFIELLDMPQLAQQHEQISLQSLSWVLRTLKKISPARAQALLESIPLSALAIKASSSNPGSINQMMRLMQDFAYSGEQLRTFVEALDMTQVAQRAKQGNLERLTSLLSTLRPISVASVTKLLAMLSPEDYVALFQRSSLEAIANFLQHQYANRHVREGYSLFQRHCLQQCLDTGPFDQINTFLDDLYKVRLEGPRLARQALELFATSSAADIVARLVGADLQNISRLLNQARRVDSPYIPQFLAPLRDVALVQTKLLESDLNTIQRLIFEVAHSDGSFILPIRQALQATGIVQKFTDALLREIGHFLWNVFSFIDPHMAHDYCMYVDQHIAVQQVATAAPGDLCFLLWNITSITNATSLRLCDLSVLQQLSPRQWHKEVGWSLVLAAIIAIISNMQQTFPLPDSSATVVSASLESGEAIAHLSRWFKTNDGGRNPYFLALALQGLRIRDEEAARQIVRRVLSLPDAIQQLNIARPSAITPRSISLMETTRQWLEQLLDGE